MGISQSHALPRERLAYARAETSFGTLIQPIATSAIKVLSCDLGDAKTDRLDRADSRATRSRMESITGNIAPIPWSLEGYLIPSGAAGTPCDWWEILKAAFGVQTTVGGASDTFSTTDTQGVQSALTIVDNLSQVVQEAAYGCVVQTLKLSGSGGDPVKIAASGVAKNKIITGRTTLSGAFSTSTATVADASVLPVGSLIAIYNASTLAVIDSNGGAGFPVATSNTTTNVITVTGSPAGTGSGNLVWPFTPAATVAGSPSPGYSGSVTLGGAAIVVTAWELELANNHDIIADEAFNQTLTDRIEGYRAVTGKLSVRARADYIKYLCERSEFGTRALSIVVGSTAGSIVTVSAGKIEFDFAGITKPDSGSATFDIPFFTIGTSGNDEATVAFT